MSRRDRIGATGFALIALAVFLALIAGSMEAADAERDRGVYCEMVADGYWPDYKGDAREVCGE